MSPTFAFTGMISKMVVENEIESTIPQKIANQQAQYATDRRDSDPQNIEVTEYAYTSAEPNCWMVYARWRVKPE